MTQFLCVKAALSQTQLLEKAMEFHVASAYWLTHMANNVDQSQFTPITFPLIEPVPQALACIPEFTMENIIDYMQFLRRFRDEQYEVRASSI